MTKSTDRHAEPAEVGLFEDLPMPGQVQSKRGLKAALTQAG